MPDKPAPKTVFVTDFAERTGMAIEEVRERVRALFDGGIGPRGHAPLTYSDVAAYLIGILASPSHKDAPAVVERFSAFFIKDADFHPELFPPFLPRLPQTPLRPFLAGIIRAFNEGGGVGLVQLSADWPPHDAYRISMITTAGKPYAAAFQPEVTAVRRMQKPDLITRTVTLPGHVVEAVAYLATTDH